MAGKPPDGHDAMKRYGMIIGLRPEKVAEYKQLHAAVWPEVLKKIRECQIRNYSIYLRRSRTGSITSSAISSIPAATSRRTWSGWPPIRPRSAGGRFCEPCQRPLADRAPKEWWANMEEVFHVD